MTEKILSQVQAAETGVFLRVQNITLRDKVRGCEILKALNVEPLLIRIERYQLCWSGHVSRMPHERLARHVRLEKPTGKRPRRRPRTRWSGYISDIAWSRLVVDPAELPEIAVDREVFRVLLRLLHPRPPRGKAGMKIGNCFPLTNHNIEHCPKHVAAMPFGNFHIINIKII